MGTLSTRTGVSGQRFSAIVPPAPNYVQNRVLAASTAETVTWPTGATVVVFGRDGDFWVRWDGSAAAVPSADVTDGGGSELNPTARSRNGQSTFSVIAEDVRKLSMAFYA